MYIPLKIIHLVVYHVYSVMYFLLKKNLTHWIVAQERNGSIDILTEDGYIEKHF